MRQKLCNKLLGYISMVHPGIHCNQPEGHDGAHMWAKPGSAMNPEGVKR